jgi:hypothetical protein
VCAAGQLDDPLWPAAHLDPGKQPTFDGWLTEVILLEIFQPIEADDEGPMNDGADEWRWSPDDDR